MRTYFAVIVLSVSGDMVRRFMLTALDMGFINGEYVFMDVELFSFKARKLMWFALFRRNKVKSRNIFSVISILESLNPWDKSCKLRPNPL